MLQGEITRQKLTQLCLKQLVFTKFTTIFSERKRNITSWFLSHFYFNLPFLFHLRPQEAEWKMAGVEPPAGWPLEGTVQFFNYSTRYRPGLEVVLRDFTCSIRHNEKVRINRGKYPTLKPHTNIQVQQVFQVMDSSPPVEFICTRRLGNLLRVAISDHLWLISPKSHGNFGRTSETFSFPWNFIWYWTHLQETNNCSMFPMFFI